MNTSFVFVLGRTPDLSRAELSSMFPSYEQKRLDDWGVVITLPSLDAAKTQELLGGTTKIGQMLTEFPEISPESMARFIVDDAKEDKLTFGISSFRKTKITRQFLYQVKEQLHLLGVSARFVEGKEDGVLTAAQVTSQHLTEYLIFEAQSGYSVARTLAVQNIDEWTARDRGRPNADAKRGMLPVKIARMMVNIALGPTAFNTRVLDPFCGMGTIVGEAYVRGAQSFGLDIQPDVVEKASENMSWIANMYPQEGVPLPVCRAGDAVHASEIFAEMTFDAIVTEPFLGPTSLGIETKISPQKVANTLKGLEKLYIGCLKDWNKILKDHGKLVMALPSISLNGREHTVKRVVDTCENFGYSIVTGPMVYSRPQAVVKRNIYIFVKKG